MNTHDKIELPPLPAYEAGFMSLEVKNAMLKYARAAIEADRQRRCEPVAWHSKQYGTVWMAVKPGNLVAGTKWFIQGRQEPVAEVMSSVSLVWHIATSELEHGTVFYTAPQPAEPVAWISRVKCVGPEYGKEYFGRLPVQSLNPLFYEHVPLYSAPQPAEPCGSPTLHNADSVAQNGIQATQPAEPVKVPSDTQENK